MWVQKGQGGSGRFHDGSDPPGPYQTLLYPPGLYLTLSDLRNFLEPCGSSGLPIPLRTLLDPLGSSWTLPEL